MVELPRIPGSESTKQRDNQEKLEPLFMTKSNTNMLDDSKRTTINESETVDSGQNYVAKKLQKIQAEEEPETPSGFREKDFYEASENKNDLNTSDISSGNILWNKYVEENCMDPDRPWRQPRKSLNRSTATTKTRKSKRISKHIHNARRKESKGTGLFSQATGKNPNSGYNPPFLSVYDPEVNVMLGNGKKIRPKRPMSGKPRRRAGISKKK